MKDMRAPLRGLHIGDNDSCRKRNGDHTLTLTATVPSSLSFLCVEKAVDPHDPPFTPRPLSGMSDRSPLAASDWFEGARCGKAVCWPPDADDWAVLSGKRNLTMYRLALLLIPLKKSTIDVREETKSKVWDPRDPRKIWSRVIQTISTQPWDHESNMSTSYADASRERPNSHLTSKIHRAVRSQTSESWSCTNNHRKPEA